MTSPEMPGVKQAVTCYGRDLAVFFRLADQALKETDERYTASWNRKPKGTVRSGTARARLLELADGVQFDEIEVTGEGEDYVRVVMPLLGSKLYLRTRPKVAAPAEDGELFSLDLFGMVGTLYLFWEAAADGSGLARLSIAEVLTPPDLWRRKCVVRNEIFITADLIPVPTSAPLGTGNYDDDLHGVVSRWESEEAQSEEETTDRAAQEERDANGTDSALGGDGV